MKNTGRKNALDSSVPGEPRIPDHMHFYYINIRIIMNLFDTRTKHYLFLIAIVAIGLFGILTMQLLLAAAIIILAFLGWLTWYYQGTKKEKRAIEQGEGEAVLGAGLITLLAMANMEFIVWGIGLAFIFMIHQSLARIERRMEMLETRNPPPE